MFTLFGTAPYVSGGVSGITRLLRLLMLQPTCVFFYVPPDDDGSGEIDFREFTLYGPSCMVDCVQCRAVADRAHQFFLACG